MDQIKIGKFISECRKEKGYTQVKLAEKLGITNRAVSKWETGKSLPDASVMIELCELLGINVNELLTGEKVSEENYKRKAEENMVEMVKKNKKSKAEIIITLLIIISIVIDSVTGMILSKMFTSDETRAAIGIMSFVLLLCLVGIWTGTTLCLKNKK
ncbi:MAG: helix-turn-helix domain-containing protein [Oscillospiraceae bacterium]|nr:helix-turn-helix domain-containing protein [Oscillospiraceae bacterium]